jgi:hypothetical protein
VRDSEIDEVRKAMQDFHAEVSDVTPRGTVDKPLMMPKPAEPVVVEVSETAPPAPKPRAKKAKTVPAETAAAKSKTPKPRAKKREESAS